MIEDLMCVSFVFMCISGVFVFSSAICIARDIMKSLVENDEIGEFVGFMFLIIFFISAITLWLTYGIYKGYI